MKKNLLVACTALVAISAMAQNRISKPVNLKGIKQQMNCYDPALNQAGSFTPAQRKTPLVITNTAVTDIPIGNAGNAFGGYFTPSRSICYADPGLNTVLVTHRSGPACTPPDGTPNSGAIMFDYSKDGGTTWNSPPSLGPVWNPAAELGRYPNGFIYNPTGNTNPDSAYIAVAGACTGPPLPGGWIWIAHYNGAAKIGMPSQQNQNTDIYDSTVNWIGGVPDAAAMTQTGNTWIIDQLSTDDASGTYRDTLIVRKGTWNATTKIFDYTTTLFPFPVYGGNISGNTMAFAPNGQTGYIVSTANNDVTVTGDSSMYLVAFKTTDGGNTWGSAIKIPVSAPVAAAFGTTNKYSTGFWPDASVDANGNLFIHVSIFEYLGGGSINTAPGTWGQFAVYTADGGITWQFKLLDKPMTFSYTTSGTSPITEYTRGQISTNWAGDKMVFVWFDTDTSQFPGGINSNPDAQAMYYDITTNTWDAKVNLTSGTASDASVTFGAVSHYLLPCGTTGWEVPIAYQVLSAGNESGCVQYHYIDGACITGVKEIDNAVFSIGGAYPNPTSGAASIVITMKKQEHILLEVTNLLGEVMYTRSLSLHAGEHTLSIDASKWASGTYFYTVRSSDFSISNKLIRN